MTTRAGCLHTGLSPVTGKWLTQPRLSLFHAKKEASVPTRGGTLDLPTGETRLHHEGYPAGCVFRIMKDARELLDADLALDLHTTYVDEGRMAVDQASESAMLDVTVQDKALDVSHFEEAEHHDPHEGGALIDLYGKAGLHVVQLESRH